MGDSAIEQQQIFSRLIDHLAKSGERINWRRLCWKDGREYYGKEDLRGKLDPDFSQSRYLANAVDEELVLGYTVNWDGQNPTDWFSIDFTKWTCRILDLKPRPRDIVLFSKNSVPEEEGRPKFQARYDTILPVCFEEANVAMQDFVENGGRLAEHFEGMEKESLERYFALIQRFQEFRDSGKIVWLSF